MNTFKIFTTIAWCLAIVIQLPAQEPIPTNVDMQTFSFQKVFLDNEDSEKNVWERKEHSCETVLPDDVRNAYAAVPKYSQSNFLSMRRSNTRLMGLNLTIPEKPFFRLEAGQNYKQIAAIHECLRGYKRSMQAYASDDVDYFNELLRYTRFVTAQEETPYYAGGRKLSFRVLRTEADLDAVLQDPTQMGAMLSVQGAHNLGSYFYIKENLVSNAEFDKKIIENLERLKGIRPLVDHTEEYLAFPISHLRIASSYVNGLGGNINGFRSLSNTQSDGQSGVRLKEDLSGLGQKLVRQMIDDKNGRRILVDVAGLHPKARKWIYDYHNRLRYHGDTIPMLALGVTVHGESLSSSNVGNARTHGNSYLSYDEASLGRDDIQAILASGGLIGITLDKEKLIAGNKVEKILAGLQEGSAEHQTAINNVLLANLFRCVQAVQDRDIWNHLVLSSGFDGGQVPFRIYESAGKLEDLKKDLLAYFENPTPVFDLYSAEQVKELMYGYSAEELVEKLFASNSIAFMRQRLQSMAKGQVEKGTAQQD